MTLIKLLLLLVLFYFIAKSIVNMARAVLNDPKAQDRVPPYQETRRPQWQGPAPARSHHDKADVEDAKWVDLG